MPGLLRGLAHRGLVRAYVTNPAFRCLVRALDAEDPPVDVFATMLDHALSRRVFQTVTMDGAQTYMYKPGPKRLGFLLSRGSGRSAVHSDTGRARFGTRHNWTTSALER